ncbi:TetR/AcrR family transcriptional regulator [Rhizobium tropici]|uniref:TetR/AcrR family transcriptional regulator n=1 Tax=Rhizobium tropici TaxID=398 RepID=A0A329YCK5_RHITR|nr:TetR/AcrR family transcriptional regulator [Rhizobium tropici]
MPLDRILSAALRIADEEGTQALTMRRLASELNSSTAMLYRHFESRADLVLQIVDYVFKEAELFALPFPQTDWRQACRSLARRMFAVLGQHRGVAQLLLEATPNGPHAMVLRERCLAMMLDNGFAPPLAARAYATLARFVLGFAIQVGRQDAAQSAAFHQLDRAAFPATYALADELPVPLEEEFAFGLDLMIAGLEAFTF